MVHLLSRSRVCLECYLPLQRMDERCSAKGWMKGTLWKKWMGCKVRGLSVTKVTIYERLAGLLQIVQ